MDSQQFADLELKTIISLAGMPPQKDLVNPRKPLEMAKRVRVTFRPLPRNYGNQIVIRFRETLENKLKEHGVQVIEVDEYGPASDAGLIKGDVITMIDNREIESLDDFENITEELKSGKSVALLVQRRSGPVFLAIRPDDS